MKLDRATEAFMDAAMSDILMVASSALRDKSISRRIALRFVDAARTVNELAWNERDLTFLPHITAALLGALRAPADARTSGQALLVSGADAIIEEVESARLIVITCPVYAHSIPSTLKAWLEHMNRPGRVFRHTDDGHDGLLTGKKVCVVITRGSEPNTNMRAFVETYLKTTLTGFGMTDVTFINAHDTAHEDGLRQIAEAEEKAALLGAAFARSIFDT